MTNVQASWAVVGVFAMVGFAEPICEGIILGASWLWGAMSYVAARWL